MLDVCAWCVCCLSCDQAGSWFVACSAPSFVKQAVAICIADHAREEASLWKWLLAATYDTRGGSGTRHFHSANVLRPSWTSHSSQGEEQCNGLAWIHSDVDPGSKILLGWLFIFIGYFLDSAKLFITGFFAPRAAYYCVGHGGTNESISIAATCLGRTS